MQPRYSPHHYGRLLVSCMALLVIFTLPDPWNRLASLGYLVMAAVMLQAFGNGVGLRRGTDLSLRIYQAMGLATLIVGGVWMLTPLHLRSTGVPVVVLWALFALWSAVRLILQLGNEQSVNLAVLRGAFAGYLMLGLAGGLVCAALETAQPGSFNGVHQGGVLPNGLQPVWRLNFVAMNYFAFTTLTTTGYGDIQPVTPLAQMASIVLAITGNIYLASVLGLLIGRFSSQFSAGHSSGNDRQGGS